MPLHLQITSSYIFDLQSFDKDLVIATGEGTIIIVDLEKWIVKKRIAVSEKSARAAAINQTAGEMAVGFSDHAIRIFSLTGRYELKQEIKGHQNSVFAVSYSSDGNFLFSGARDAHLKVWDVKSNYSLAEDVAAHLVCHQSPHLLS